MPGPGEVLGGKYVVERLIAEGGMGAVLAARHARLGHRVAIKVLQPYTRSMPEIAGRFEREARAAAQIRSRNVARVIDVEALPDGSPFMVMELLEGHDLGAEIEARGSIPPAEAVGYALEACAGMAEAHRLGIVHRDLKPSNLFLAVEGDQRTVKVLDFGISKLTADADVKMTATNSVLGTPLYMSPEQVRSAKNVDERTDIWSLGVILYEMLSGQVPFVGESATAIAASIVADDIIPIASRGVSLPPGLADVVMKALSKKPADRFQDIGELAAALQPFDGKSRPRPASVVRVTPVAVGVAAGEVSVDAQTVSSGPSEPPAPAVGSSTPPLPAAREELPAGAGRTAPGWSVSSPAGSGARRAVVVGAVAVGVLGLGGAFRALSSRGTLPAAANMTAATAAASGPTAQAGPEPTLAPAPEGTGAAPATATAPLVSPAPATASASALATVSAPHVATAKSSASPPSRSPRVPASAAQPTAAPAAQPTAAPAAKPTAAPRSPPVGLPSHI